MRENKDKQRDTEKISFYNKYIEQLMKYNLPEKAEKVLERKKQNMSTEKEGKERKK